jgi:PAS domain S-box-containing protein
MNFYNEKFSFYRKKNRLSVSDFCKATDISRTTLWQWETGRRVPNEETVYFLASVLKVEVNEISDLNQKFPTKKTNAEPLISSFRKIAETGRAERELLMGRLSKEIFEIEKNLEQTNMIINALIESFDIMFYIKDVDLKYVLADKEFLKNFSLHESYNVLGQMDEDFFNKKECKYNTEEDKKILLTGKPIRNIEHYMPNSRKQRIAQVSKLPIFNRDNVIIGVMGVFVDITERKKNEQLFRIVESNINSMKDSLIITDGSKWLYTNKAVESLFGYPREKFYTGGTDFFLKNCVHKEDLEKKSDIIKNRKWAEVARCRIITPAGKIKWVEGVRSENEYLGKKCKITICRDITDSLSLENSRELLINALNKSEDVFVLTSYSSLGTESFYSKAIEEMTGISVEDFYNTKYTIKDFVHPDDFLNYYSLNDIRNLIVQRKDIPKFTKFRLADAKNRTKWIENRFFYFEENDVVYVGCIFRDITLREQNTMQLEVIEKKNILDERMRIAEKMKAENISSEIILKVTGVKI